MEKFVPYEKLSKKEKRRMDEARRGSWHGVNPVTRKSENPKAYKRSKARQWKEEACRALFLPCRKNLRWRKVYIRDKIKKIQVRRRMYGEI